MARIIHYYLLALVIFIVTPFPQSAIADDTKTYIVILKEGCDTSAHYEWMNSEQRKTTVSLNTEPAQMANLTEVLKTFSIGSTNGYVGELSESWVRNVLAKRSDVDSVEINGKVKVLAPVDPPVSSKTKLKNIDMMDTTGKPLFDKSFTYPELAGKGIKVYVIDTGILTTHVEFEGRAKMAKVVCKDCVNTDDNGHGSHVAGIVGGRMVGVARKVSLFGVKVFDASGEGTYAELIAGMKFVADEKKADKSGIFVANISIGGEKSKAVNAVTDALSKQGIHVFVAAGNDFDDACKVSPASTKSAITVGAVEELALVNSDDSNFGPCVDIFAPGENVLSCGIFNDKSYVQQTGSSMATPHVAGVAALILDHYGEMTPYRLEKFIKAKALANEMTFAKGTEKGTPNLFASIDKMF